ncbi:DNA repair protein RecO [Thermosediminibacter oceani]|uniref:DNA repair protein RecO n=1 Tax=Thermosediminibacter oceani (strain ATCC BAA-1034 / DSM 16646 / JW/IW-1228P) TaxID=555079 RepID=D9S2Q9_THEOJ|nr:DNA repair protein RecO [Thermosediminibacter oceani]ADL07686.1 DNA repair protein RecO [Thermosediminibacter oceani DSM 16646]
MGLYTTEAVVVGYRDLGEADRILTLFSPERGKIHAVARGVRRPRSPLMAGTQLFSYSKFLLVEGRNLDSISQCELKESFFRIREDLDRMAYGSYFAELLRISTRESEKSEELFRFFMKVLYLLQVWEDLEFMARIFELKLMALQGYTPQLSHCVNCRNDELKEIRFSHALGGILCEKCRGSDEKSVVISRAVLMMMRRMLKGKFEDLAKLKVEDGVKEELKAVLTGFVLHHMERKPRTLRFLDDIAKISHK